MVPPEVVVLVVVDCLRADHLACLGYARPTAPGLDAAAKSGSLFAACYPQGIYTFPSHVSLLTGNHHAVHRLANGDVYCYATPTLPAYLRDLGYRSAAFVSNGMLAADMGLGRDFDHYDDGSRPGEGVAWSFSRPAEATAEAALTWLASQAGEKLFVWLHFNDCHGPITLPEDYARLFVEDALYEPGPMLSLGSGPGRLPAAYALPGQRAAGYYQAQYDAAIRYIDDQLQRVLAAIYARYGGAERVLTVLLGDHGEAMGEHGHYFTHGKGFYEEFIRTPLLMWGGGAPAGWRWSAPVRHIDILPTLIVWAGGQAPAGIQGRSLLPLWRDVAGFDVISAEGAGAETTLVDYNGWSAYIRRGRWKYISHNDHGLLPFVGRRRGWARWLRWRFRSPQAALYDVLADPQEKVDRLPEWPAVGRALRVELLAQLRAYRAITLPQQAAGPRPNGAEVEARLRALGYVA